MKKITTVLLALLISLSTIGCFGGNPGNYIEIEADPSFIEMLSEPLANTPEAQNVEFTKMRFYEDYEKSYNYYRKAIDNASWKEGYDDVLVLKDSFPEFPELKQYLEEYGVMSLNIDVDLYVEEETHHITYTVLYLVDRTTDKVSYWTYSNDFTDN